MKKILIIWKEFYPWDIRIEKFCLSLSKYYKVRLLCRWEDNQPEFEENEYFEIKRVNFFNKTIFTIPISNNPFWTNGIENSIKEFKPDLMIVREILIANNVGLLARKYSIPVLMDMAENYPAAMRLWKKYNSNILLKSLMHDIKLPDLIEKKSVSLMDGIITVCEEQLPRLRDLGFKGKNQVVYNTPYNSFDYINLNIDNNSNDIVLCHHGWLSMDKDISNFIESFLDVIKVRKDLKLIIAGIGECYNDYISKYDHLSENIIFTGKFSYTDLPSILSKVDYGILPYEPNDFNNFTIQNKIFDYMAFGKPVIVSNTKTLERIVNVTQCGYVYNYFDKNSLSNLIMNISKDNYSNLSDNSKNASDTIYNWKIDEQNLVNFVQGFL